MGLSKSNTTLIPKDSVMIAITGATFGQISINCIDTCTNQSVVSILCNNKLPLSYVYPMIKDRLNDLINLQTGGAQQHINKGNIENMSINFYNNVDMKSYTQQTDPIYKKISKNCLVVNKLNELKQLYLKKFFN